MRWLRYILSLGRFGGTDAVIPTPHFIWTFSARSRTWDLPAKNRKWDLPNRN